MARHEGLVGLIADRQEPLNLEDAAAHPRYRYFPETGEEHYHGFIGVPIIHYRQVLGVLVAQHRERRLFNPNEAAFLVTVAAGIGGAIQTARRTGGMSGSSERPGFLQGIAGAPGVAIGTIAISRPLARLADVPDRPAEDTDREQCRCSRRPLPASRRSCVAWASAWRRCCPGRSRPSSTSSRCC